MAFDHPQRLTPIAAPGALLKRLADLPQLHTRLRMLDLSDPVYLARVREMPCLKCGVEPCGEAHHARDLRSITFGRRQPDRHAVPLCRGCHTKDEDALHKIGHEMFWDRVGLNPIFWAQKLYAVRHDVVAMRAACLVAIASRKMPNNK